MNRIRLATPEEIEPLKANSDLDPTCTVLALESDAGTAFAVIRHAVEVDPVHFPKGYPDRMKAVFVRDIETCLTAWGIPSYYFNVLASDEDWMKAVVKWGAEQISVAPEQRFKRTL
jgi:hypothetical protein